MNLLFEGPGDAALRGALSGVRVIDLTQLLPGPFATLRLAQWGAEVIKIEPPAGDPARRFWRSAREQQQGEPGPWFRQLNAGKELVTLDLRSPAGRAELIERICAASVLVEGLRPGALARLGLAPELLAQANPRLVHVAITGYGQNGPWSRRAGHDLNYLAMSGVLDQIVSSSGELAIPNLQIGDLLGGAQAALGALLAALWRAERHGRGCYLDISMTHELMRHQVAVRAAWAATGQVPRGGQDLLSGGAPCYAVYPTADRRHIAVAALEHKFWAALCHVLGRTDWVDGHWSRGLVPGSRESHQLRDDLAALLSTQTSVHWQALFDPVDCCVTPVLRLDEAQAWFAAR